jgi:AMME syndrome candidate gene 1 protein
VSPFPCVISPDLLLFSASRSICTGAAPSQRTVALRSTSRSDSWCVRAFDDVRFQPIALRELPSLEVAVTLLTDFEPAADPMDWELGKHGIRLSFTHHGRRYGSCYLPDVAREQGWTKEETIVSLMRKSGWSGRKDDWKKIGLDVIRYQGKAISLAYDDWKQWRDWASAQGYEKEHLN